jgi:O-antigen ligase
MAADLGTGGLIGLALAIAVAAAIAGELVSRWTGWRAAGGLVVLAATPLIPYVPIASGVSLDDVLPVVGLILLLRGLGTAPSLRGGFPMLLLVGFAVLVAAATASSLVNATNAVSAVGMLLRGPGRYVFLAAIAVTVASAQPDERRRLVVARAMALLGTFEALFGLAAFFLPVGGIGLEPARKHSVLFLEIPGRIAGTLGISPNFLGAIFILTILLTVGLALEARDRRVRLLWWAAATIQAFALTLTFTRASLGLSIVGIGVLLLIRGRPRAFLPIALAVALALVLTPAGERLTADVPDRLALWSSATQMMIDHPLTGVGPGRTLEAARQQPERYLRTPFGSAVNNAHNTILLAGAESGIGGALGAVAINVGLALAALQRLRTTLRRKNLPIDLAAGIAVLAYLIQGMVNNLFTVGATSVVFVLVAGAFVLLPDRELADDPQRQREPTGPPLELSAWTGDKGPA